MTKSLMKFAAMASTAIVASAQGDVEAKTSDVTAQFMGASGGLKLLKNDGSGAYIFAQQEKIQEVGADGGPCKGQCFSLNVAGKNEWTPLETTTTDNGKDYSTTFTVLDGGDVNFALTAHLADSTMTTTDVVPCSGCFRNETKLTSLPGVCERQNCVDPSDNTGNCPKQCVDAEADGTCRKDFALCSETVSIQESQLKFSFVLGGLVFKDPTNKLTYGLSLKTNAEAVSGEEMTSAASSQKVSIGGSTFDMPTKAIVKAWDKEDREVDVTITMENKGSKLDINFEFPAMEEGDVLYYDPTLALPVSDSNSASSTGLPLVTMFAVGALALL